MGSGYPGGIYPAAYGLSGAAPAILFPSVSDHQLLAIPDTDRAIAVPGGTRSIRIPRSGRSITTTEEA